MESVQIRCLTFDDLRPQRLTWPPGPAPLVLYGLGVAELDPLVPWLLTLLTSTERHRADRYHRPADRLRFIVARGGLRSVLGLYIRQGPAAVVLGPDRQKKPVAVDFPDLHYNVSHAANQVLIAVGRHPVGVDVERIETGFDWPTLLPGSFSQAEQRFIRAGPDGRAAFYHLWTRKEALAKATGKGIDDDFAKLPALDGLHTVAAATAGTTENWVVGSFSPAGDYRAAVAYRGAAPAAPPPFYWIGPAELTKIYPHTDR